MKAVVLLLFALVAASFAEDLDLDELEKELVDSPLEEVDPGLTDKKRFIFGWLFRRSCSCDKTSCQCCAQPRLFGAKINGCMKLTAKPESKEIVVDVTAFGNDVLSKSFPTSETGKYCGQLPGKANFLTFCLNTDITGNEETGITFCSQLDVKLKETTAVNVNFRCVELKDGKITFSANKMPSNNGILNLKARDVFKKVVELLLKR